MALTHCAVQARLVKMVAKGTLDIPLPELESRLSDLLVLVPDLGALLPPPRRKRRRVVRVKVGCFHCSWYSHVLTVT